MVLDTDERKFIAIPDELRELFHKARARIDAKESAEELGTLLQRMNVLLYLHQTLGTKIGIWCQMQLERCYRQLDQILLCNKRELPSLDAEIDH